MSISKESEKLRKLWQPAWVGLEVGFPLLLQGKALLPDLLFHMNACPQNRLLSYFCQQEASITWLWSCSAQKMLPKRPKSSNFHDVLESLKHALWASHDGIISNQTGGSKLQRVFHIRWRRPTAHFGQILFILGFLVSWLMLAVHPPSFPPFSPLLCSLLPPLSLLWFPFFPPFFPLWPPSCSPPFPPSSPLLSPLLSPLWFPLISPLLPPVPPLLAPPLPPFFLPSFPSVFPPFPRISPLAIILEHFTLCKSVCNTFHKYYRQDFNSCNASPVTFLLSQCPFQCVSHSFWLLVVKDITSKDLEPLHTTNWWNFNLRVMCYIEISLAFYYCNKFSANGIFCVPTS